MYTFAEAKDKLWRFVDGGVAQADPRVADRINDAVEMLMCEQAEHNHVVCMRVCAGNGCFAAPRNVRRVLKARFEGGAANVWTKWHEFHSDGLGMQTDQTGCFVDVFERGHTPTQFDLPYPMHLLALSDEPEVLDCALMARGYDETGREIRGPLGTQRMGELLPVRHLNGVYSKFKFASIASITKPRTNGDVYLSGVTFNDDLTEMTRVHLAHYHANETTPMYKRYTYQLSDNCDCADQYHRLNLLVQLAFVKMEDDSDVIPVEPFIAVQLAVQAIDGLRRGNTKEFMEFSALAKAKMALTSEEEQGEPEMDIEVKGYSMADIPANL